MGRVECEGSVEKFRNIYNIVIQTPTAVTAEITMVEFHVLVPFDSS